MAHGLKSYIKNWENWLQWTIAFGALLCVTPQTLVPSNLPSVPQWQHHIAAVVVLLVWLELMMLVGRFPIFGVYVQMFTKVAVNFGKFLLAYICLLIAFGLSFSVLFNDYPAFENITWSVLKSITMMSGELEFEDIFYGDYKVKFPVTAHIVFLSFVLLVTVILTNLMVGLAVSDIQGLQVSASLDRLVRQAELISRLESIFYSRLLRGTPTRLLRLCKRSAMLRTSRNNLQFVTRPNDPRDNHLPEEIKINIYKLVADRRDRQLSQRRRKFENNYNIFNKSLQRETEIENNNEVRKLTSTNLNATTTNNALLTLGPSIKTTVNTIHEGLLRPRSATNVPNQILTETDLSLKLKSQIIGFNELRSELQLLREQLEMITDKFDRFAEGASKKLSVTAEELGRLRRYCEHQLHPRKNQNTKDNNSLNTHAKTLHF